MTIEEHIKEALGTMSWLMILKQAEIDRLTKRVEELEGKLSPPPSA